MSLLLNGKILSKLDPRLTSELLATYEDAKRNFFLGGLRLQSVEGGRFCEAAFRILEMITKGAYTPIGRPLPSVDDLLRDLSNLKIGTHSDSVRLHIPRALRVVYDIRNSRDAAHLGDGIDPNLQDATLVCSILDWVLAELIRLDHQVSPKQAQDIVDGLVTRKIPVVQEFDGFPKVLKSKLSAGNHCLVILYGRSGGATFLQLESWVRPSMKKNLRRTLWSLEHDKSFIHDSGDLFRITTSGQKHVEAMKLLEF